MALAKSFSHRFLEKKPSNWRIVQHPRHFIAINLIAILGCTGIGLASNAQTLSGSSPPADPAPTVQTLAPITVTGRQDLPSFVGLGAEPPPKTPVSASTFDARRIAELGATRAAELYELDAATTDAYNTAGYWDYATVRGYVLSNRSNFLREGLPISAETSISLFNKERVDVLKGASGLQSGTSSPGGLINYGVKRPTAAPIRQVQAQLDSAGNRVLSLDISQRFGGNDASVNAGSGSSGLANGPFGIRINAALERLDTPANGGQGHGRHVALAASAQLRPGSLIEVDLEHSLRSQPSVPGQSLWGNALPAPNATLNANLQSWSLPVVLGGQTGSIRLTQELNRDWNISLQAQSQKLVSDDRVAFPYGCSAPSGTYYSDRYCPSGEADVYDFRSEGERRNTRVVQALVSGAFSWGAVGHQLRASFTRSVRAETFNGQAYNYVGTGALTAAYPADPSINDVNTNRQETSREISLSDRMQLNPALSLWLGVRHTELERASVRTDGSRVSQYGQSFNSPFAALGYQLHETTFAYASASQGIESEVAPARSRYTNAGLALPALRSRQSEVGIKHGGTDWQWSATAFAVSRPVAADAGACAGTRDCTRQNDGSADHSGLEASATHRLGPWRLNASAMLLRAVRQGSTIAPAQNGLQPTNVPTRVLRAAASYTPMRLQQLTLDAHLSHEGPRMVLPDNTVQLPSWNRLDLAARYLLPTAGPQWTLLASVDNALNRPFFKESPYQFGHVYLFTAPPRTIRLNLIGRL